MRITQETIARNVGVDRTTVSICLGTSNSRIEKIRPEVRARILEEAKRLNYRPNFFATQLRRGHSNIILACVMKLQDYHASLILEAFARRAAQSGHRVIVSCFADTSHPKELIHDILGPHGVSSLALITRASDYLPADCMADYLAEGVQVVLVGRKHENPRIGQVFVDERQSARLAVDHLLQTSEKPFWIVAYEQTFWRYQEDRIDFIQETLRARRKQVARVLRVRMADNDQDIPTIVRTVQAALKTSELPGAFLCVTDILAWGTLRALTELGVAVGRDTGVMSYGNLFPSMAMSPALTAIDEPARRMGEIGADLMLQLLEKPKVKLKPQKLSAQLIIRQSTGQPPNQA